MRVRRSWIILRVASLFGIEWENAAVSASVSLEWERRERIGEPTRVDLARLLPRWLSCGLASGAGVESWTEALELPSDVVWPRRTDAGYGCPLPIDEA
jgi:hypothetical protein